MRYVIVRDDDTNAFTPVECLETLYRPFLDRGLPVNLAVIPEVATNTRMADGRLEGFLLNKNGRGNASVPIGANTKLVRYLLDTPGFQVVQHGFNHDYFEFDRLGRQETVKRLELGTRSLCEAGFPQPQTFVAPYDKLSRSSMEEVAQRFQVISTGWFELRRLPLKWWPRYVLKKARGVPHWRVGRTLLLSHPGCLLSCHRNQSSILDTILHYLGKQQLTVLVTHWWEYFREGQPQKGFIGSLHQTAEYLAARRDIRVISFSDLVNGRIALS